MSQQITEAFVQQFTQGIFIQAQQKGSKLKPYVRSEDISGKSKAFDRLGSAGEMQEKVGRHSDTQHEDTPHSKRWCFLKDFTKSDLIDDEDKIRVLNEPTSEYVMLFMWAAGRKMDDYILAAADAVVKTGEDADGTAALPNGQRLAAIDGNGAFANLSVDTLIKLQEKFDENEIDESFERHIAVSAKQISAMLNDDRITSQDYNTVKALVEGKINQFMGFTFHKLQRVTKQVGALTANPGTGAVGSGAGDVNGFRKVVAWIQPSIILGIGQNPKGRISELPSKNYATQAFVSMTIGSTRMEDESVMVAYCKED
jgi:hypothetical protein